MASTREKFLAGRRVGSRLDVKLNDARSNVANDDPAARLPAVELAWVARRVFVLQGGLILAAAAVLLLAGLVQASLGAAFGGGLGMMSTVLSRRSADRSAAAALKAPQMALVPVYMGLLNKIVVVGGGLAVGLIVLELPPLYVVSGYVVSQLALIAVAVTSRTG